eukprot:gene29421-35513_t
MDFSLSSSGLASKTFGSKKKITAPFGLSASVPNFSLSYGSIASGDQENVDFSSLKRPIPPDNTKNSRARTSSDVSVSRANVRSKTSKVKLDVRGLVHEGHRDDILYLRECVERFRSGLVVLVYPYLVVTLPVGWNRESLTRFEEWILKLGFVEESNQAGAIFAYHNELTGLADALNSSYSVSAWGFQSIHTSQSSNNHNVSNSTHSSTSANTANPGLSIVRPPSRSDGNRSGKSTPRMRCTSASSLDNQIFDGTPSFPSGGNSPVPPIGRTRSNTASLVPLSQSSMAAAPLKPVSISIDTSGINFHKPRTESRDSPFDAGSPSASNSTPSVRSMATVNDSRPSSTRSYTSKSPVTESLTLDWTSKLNLSSANKSDGSENSNPIAHRKTRVGQYSANLSRINSEESVASADEKEKKEEAKRGLMPEKTASFTFFTEEYAASKGEVVDADRQTPFSDTSTVLDESFSDTEGDDLLMSPTRKNSALVTDRSTAAALGAAGKAMAVDDKHNTPLSGSKATDSLGNADGSTGLASFTNSLLTHFVEKDSNRAPAFDRPPIHPRNVHFSGSNGPDDMEYFKNSSNQLKRQKEDMGVVSIRRATTEPLPTTRNSNPLAAHLESPQLTSSSSCPISFHPPSEANLYTPQTKVCCETPWLQSAGADLTILDFLTKKLESLCLSGIKCIKEAIEGENDSPIATNPILLHRAQSVSAVMHDSQFGLHGSSRFSSGSNRDSDVGYMARYVQEDGGRASMASHDGHRWSHANSDPPPMDGDLFEGSHVSVRPRASTAYEAHHPVFDTPLKGNADISGAHCASSFFNEISQKPPGSLSMSNISQMEGNAQGTAVFGTNSNVQLQHSYSNPHIASMQYAPSNIAPLELAVTAKSNGQRLRSKQAKLRRRSSIVQVSHKGVQNRGGVASGELFSSEEKRKRRQSMAYIQGSVTDSPTGAMLGCDTDAVQILDPHMLPFSSYSTEDFRKQAKVLGALCTYTFENKSPVVHPPLQQQDTQIQHVKLSDDGVLRFCLRQQGSSRWVDLGYEWVYLPASPNGYLVTRSVPNWRSKVTFYYLHKHPDHYASTRGGGGHNNNSAMCVSVNSSGAHSGGSYYENIHLHQTSANSNMSTALGHLHDESGMQHAGRVRSLDSELDAVADEDMVVDRCFAPPQPSMALLSLQIDSIPEEVV